MVNANYQQNTNRGLALERMMSFIQRFGRNHFHLACHAAFPIALTPDLLYRIWTCFTPDAPWTAVSDVLLSSLCREVGYELYEMNLDVRSLLLEELKEDFGQQRLDELSDFLIQYAAEKFSFDASDKNSLDQQSLALAQEWTVLSYKKFDEISNRLNTLQQNLNQGNFEEFVRLVSLTQALPQSIVEFADLLIYANGVARWVRRDAVNAANWFNQLPREGGAVAIGGEKFGLPLQSKAISETQKDQEIILPDLDEDAEDSGAKSEANTHTRTKIRYGQILDRLTGEILRRTNLDLEISSDLKQNSDGDEIRVDYALFESSALRHFIEVTQTDRNNSLQMKSLRYFNLVADVKSIFGIQASAISLIYGLPDQELPQANLQSSLSFFDAAFLPRVDDILRNSEKAIIAELEQDAMKLAANKFSQADAVEQLMSQHAEAVRILVKYFQQAISKVEINPALSHMWSLEQERIRNLELSSGNRTIETSYKQGMLQALYLTEAEFEELRRYSFNPETGRIDTHAEHLQLPGPLLNRIKTLQIAREVNGRIITGEIELNAELQSLLRDTESLAIVELARKSLQRSKIKWFFEDIYDDQRRQHMALHYLSVVSQGVSALEEALYENSINENYAGVMHARCWMADLVVVHLQKTQSDLSKLVEGKLSSFRRAGSTFTDFTMKYARTASNHIYTREVAHAISQVWSELIEEQKSSNLPDSDALSNGLLQARLKAAIKLNNFNPLHVALKKKLDDAGWIYKSEQVASILTDLTASKSVGKFQVYVARKGSEKIYLNIVYAKGNPTDKAKEWAARGRAMRYRYQNGKIDQVNTPMIFVCDGQWDAKSLRRLKRGGWQTCTLNELSEILDRFQFSR